MNETTLRFLGTIVRNKVVIHAIDYTDTTLTRRSLGISRNNAAVRIIEVAHSQGVGGFGDGGIVHLIECIAGGGEAVLRDGVLFGGGGAIGGGGVAAHQVARTALGGLHEVAVSVD